TRKLVFLISDFRWSEPMIEQAFDALALHDVAPIVLVDSVESAPPKWGVLALRDSESGRRQTLLMRPALRRRWIEAEQARRRRLARLLSRRSRAPIYVEDSLDPVDLSIRLTAA
ncbi:MAG: MxaS protein, partial [Alphaproteobacteria bacterium]|nr:MxaS protein [Alphaproteobacteria bacterium]